MELDNKAILWCQGTTPTTPSDIVIDGKQSVYEHQNDQDLAIGFINTAKKTKVYSHKDGDNTSPSFMLWFSKHKKKDTQQWLFVQGNYHTKDDVGRLRVYQYAFRLFENSDVVTTFIQYSKMIGCEPFDTDIEKIMKYTTNKKTISWKTRTIIITIALVALLSIIFLR